jgi:hypothetical protein
MMDQVILWLGVVLLLTGCSHAAPIRVLACVDLPRDDRRSHNLSGLAWDPATGVLLAVSDRDPWLVPLRPSPDFLRYELGTPIPLDVDVASWDGEAVAVTPEHLYVANEVDPAAVFRFDRAGHGAVRLDLPEPRGIRENYGIESTGVTPDGRFLFVANEEALEGDGPLSDAAHGTLVRIRRRELATGADLEVAYRTDPVYGDGPLANNGVTDVTPLSATRALVTERAWIKGKGNGVKIFVVDLAGAKDVAGVPALGADHAAIGKRLLVDVATLPDDGCAPPPGPQRRRTLENYEGLAIGPTLPDGRRLLFLVSDDNHGATQTARILTLAVAPEIMERP